MMKYSLWILVLVLFFSIFSDAENIYDEGDLKDGDDFEFVNEVSLREKTVFVFKSFLVEISEIELRKMAEFSMLNRKLPCKLAH